MPIPVPSPGRHPPDQRARRLIAQLQLQPHPEGGWYREVFRPAAQVVTQDGRTARNALTSIYFLLESGQQSRWHQVRSDEVWVYLEGAPLDLWIWDASANLARRAVLGPVSLDADLSLSLAMEPQHVVASGLWQAARPQSGVADRFTLAACMVGPGFDFSDFRMMQTGGEEAQAIRNRHPDLATFI